MTVPRGATDGALLAQAGITVSETNTMAAKARRRPLIKASQADHRKHTSTRCLTSIGKPFFRPRESRSPLRCTVGTASASLLESTSRYGRLEADYRAHPAGSYQQRPGRSTYESFFQDPGCDGGF